jgi:hypothetical protein
VLKFVNQFLKAYNDLPLFYYSHSATLSHAEWGSARLFDNDLSRFVHNFYKDPESKDAILILLADHGHRYGRDGLGKNPTVRIEERSPTFVIMFPEWFKAKYPRLVAQVRSNSNLTIAPYDIHATLQHLIAMTNKNVALPKTLGTSIFTPMPSERSCKQANIPEHFCTCSKWITTSITCSVVQLLLRFIKLTNEELENANNSCGKLKLVHIGKVENLAVDPSVFSVATDRHGRRREKHAFSSNTVGGYVRIHFTLTASSRGVETREKMLYEMTARLNQRVDFFDGTSRLDMYGDDAKCVEKGFPHLRSFCACF